MQRQSVRDLPENKNPIGSRCITIDIPDDDDWERQAFSELYRLGLWMLWERNPGKDGAPVAKRWRQALSTWRHCDGTPTPVILNGEFDMSELCELLRWHEGKLQAWCCGEWTDIPTDGSAPIPGSGGQPGSGSRPAAGQSKCYVLTVPAGGSWVLPFGVQNGDTVTITNLDGAWSADPFQWTCPDGTPFVLGACFGSRYHVGGDPDATLYHGQVAIVVDGQYLSGTDGPVVLSGLSGQQQLVVQPNFNPIAGAGGAVTLKLCITNGTTPPAGEWCFEMDLTLSDYGLTPYPNQGIYYPGLGWGLDPAHGFPNTLEIHQTFMTAQALTYWSVTFDADLSSTGGVGCALYTGAGQWVRDDSLMANGEHTIVATTPLSQSDAFTSFIGGVFNSLYIKRMTFKGTGVNPFPASNC